MVMIALAFVVGAAALSGRWLMRRASTVGSERPFPVVSVSVLGVVAVALSVPSYLRVREENRLSSVASRLVEAPVRVHCQTFGQTFTQLGPELGYVRYGADDLPEHQTFLARGVCRDLAAYLGSDKRHPSADQIVAVHVLTHESMHMRGITNEARAECAAMQRDARTAELLGANPAAADGLARLYWLDDYPTMPAGYRSSDCGPGQAWDEHLSDAPWAPPAAG